ncbi:hypothetical protein TIFTF001_014183 [Ficus carica]|uniref:Uncharacterized protein n=1 Tax=Ficus carica TaxID=3494 RepID=A0AA88A2A0_FICCA|nr:hypothetical protein TIFTF001_014183 [Ficus carica]
MAMMINQAALKASGGRGLLGAKVELKSRSFQTSVQATSTSDASSEAIVGLPSPPPPLTPLRSSDINRKVPPRRTSPPPLYHRRLAYRPVPRPKQSNDFVHQIHRPSIRKYIKA